MDESEKNRIAIVGGGITGLTLALFLSRNGWAVTVFEKEMRTGGLAAGFRAGPLSLDKYYRHIFSGHDELTNLIRSLGLENRLVFNKAPMAYFSQGRVYPLNSPIDLLRFKPLALLDRLRVGISASTFLFRKKWQSFDAVTAASLLEKRCGKNGYTFFWQPLLKNKFGAHTSSVSATWLWDRLQSRTRGRLGRSSGALGYLRGGFMLLIERMEAEIIKNGGRIMTGLPVVSIEKTESAVKALILNHDRSNPFSACLVTVPLPEFIKAVPTLPHEYREQLGRIEYSHSICMILRLRKPLSPFYWINVGDDTIPFAVIVEHTNWIRDPDHPGEHVVYLSRYCNRNDDPALNSSDEELFDAYCGYLKKIFKDFNDSQILDYHIFRDLYTQPVFKAHYSRVLPSFITPLDNLFLVNTSQFYPRSRCMNTSLILADEFLSFWRERQAQG